MAGGIAVPLCITHPLPEIEYVLNDAGVEKLVCHPSLEKLIFPIMVKTGIHVIKTSEIKTGGYKVSALEIEEALRRHPAIEECAVVGTEDPTWGERVSAAVMLREGKSLSFEEMRGWTKDEIAGYKVPTKYRIVGQLPRNAMGKVVKPKAKKLFS